jgi:YgiT-type zinc finger domain-containing protein
MTPNFRPPAELRKYPSLCIQCGGPVEEDQVTLSLVGRDGRVRLVRGVPAGVCRSCGEQYLRPDVTAHVEELLKTPPRGNEEVPAWDFAATA